MGGGELAFLLAPLLAMQLGVGPGSSVEGGVSEWGGWGKLIEINLVMNIVRIALIVLAMVFSASPLPFSSVETQTFLNCWWGGVAWLYLGMSDYFHVVRSAAYLSLWRAYNFSDSGTYAGGVKGIYLESSFALEDNVMSFALYESGR